MSASSLSAASAVRPDRVPGREASPRREARARASQRHQISEQVMNVDIGDSLQQRAMSGKRILHVELHGAQRPGMSPAVAVLNGNVKRVHLEERSLHL